MIPAAESLPGGCEWAREAVPQSPLLPRNPMNLQSLAWLRTGVSPSWQNAFPRITVAFAGAQRWQLKAAWHLPYILFLYHFNYINQEMGAVRSTQGIHLWILQVLSLWFQTLQSIAHKEKCVNNFYSALCSHRIISNGVSTLKHFSDFN